MEKLNYMTVTKPNIIFAVSIMSQLLLARRTTHLHANFEIFEERSKKRVSLLDKDTKVAISQMQIGLGVSSIGDHLQILCRSWTKIFIIKKQEAV